jgi:hypothetical protein
MEPGGDRLDRIKHGPLYGHGKQLMVSSRPVRPRFALGGSPLALILLKFSAAHRAVLDSDFLAEVIPADQAHLLSYDNDGKKSVMIEHSADL